VNRRVRDRVKRAVDFLGALVLFVVLSPALLLIALAILVTSGPPVLFRQVRPGRDETPFTLCKFRTMRAAPQGSSDVAAVASDAERLTPLGRLLRSASLDELPQLLNVLSGDMSFVGPRPLLSEYLGHYSPRQSRRHEVRPGITGWAQVNGRNSVSWDEKLEMDVWYVENRSLALDARILALTLATVLKREGVTAAGAATMTPFVERRDESADTGHPADPGSVGAADTTPNRHPEVP
jgi:sugar transferase EpsL